MVTGFVARALAFYAAHDFGAKRLQTRQSLLLRQETRPPRAASPRSIPRLFIPPRTPERNGAISKHLPASEPTGSAVGRLRCERMFYPIWLMH